VESSDLLIGVSVRNVTILWSMEGLQNKNLLFYIVNLTINYFYIE